MENLNLEKSLKMNSREFKEWINGIANVLFERFSKDLAQGKINFPEAVKQALITYTENQRDMANQILSGYTTSYPPKMKILQELLLDEVYESLNMKLIN